MLRCSEYCHHNRLQVHKCCTQALVNFKPEIEVIGNTGDDKPTPPPQRPKDQVKRLLDLGELVEMVESLKLQREFMQFLNDQLIQYYGNGPHKRIFVPLQIPEGSAITAELDNRFKLAIYKLYQLYCRESRADALFGICFTTFQMRRTKFIMENIDNRSAFKDALSQLIHFDKNPVIVEQAYREMKVFSLIHELIYDIKYDLRYKKFTRKSFEKKLNLIYKLPLGEYQYEKFNIPTCSPFLCNRGELVKLFCLHIDKEVDSMLFIMKNIQKDIQASELIEKDHCVGRIVHIDIEELKTISLSSSCDGHINRERKYDQREPKYILTEEDHNAIRDGFFKFYRRFTPKSSLPSGSKTDLEIDFKTDSQNSDMSSDSDSDWDTESVLGLEPSSRI